MLELLPLSLVITAAGCPRWAMGGDVGTTPQCPKAASLLSTSPAMSPKPDIMTGCPQRPRLSELRSATTAIPSPLASLPPPEKPTYCSLRQPRASPRHHQRCPGPPSTCSRIAKGRRLRSSPLRSEPAVPTSPASNPAASTPVLLEAEAINSQDICMGMCSRIAKGRLRSSPLRSEPAVPTSPASSPVASTPVLLEAEAFNSQDFCFTPFDLGMWAIFCDSLIGNKQTRDLHSNDALLCIHADSATALMDSRHLALALLAKLA